MNRRQEGREAVIVEAVRTPVGRGHPEKGYYKDLHPADLLGRTYVELLNRAGVDPSEVEDVLRGCAQQMAEQWEIPPSETRRARTALAPARAPGHRGGLVRARDAADAAQRRHRGPR